MAATHQFTIYFNGGDERTLNVIFTPRAYGGWDVRRAHNHRLLGWLTYDPTKPVKTRWEARTGDSAFRGDGLDGGTDEGYPLDEVPSHLTARREPLQHDPVGLGRNRADATYQLLYWLLRQRAPAVGFGPHPDVTPWRPAVDA